MIISSEKKIGVFLVPRTGTFSLSTLFRQSGLNLDLLHHGHQSLNALRENPPCDLTGFRYFSFYRDPYDRAISVVNYLRRGRQCAKFYHAFYGDSVRISCADRKTYYELSDELRALNDAIPMIDVFRKFRWFFDNGAYGRTHKKWLDYPEVEPLNFHDYDNELNRLLREFDLNPAQINKPKMNSSISIPELDVLSDSEQQEIRNFLAEDYEFLASKGISFQ